MKLQLYREINLLVRICLEEGPFGRLESYRFTCLFADVRIHVNKYTQMAECVHLHMDLIYRTCIVHTYMPKKESNSG